MSDPRQAEVWHKKPEIADRTLNERKYCKLCDYFYSEMFTCPICYGEARATDRIIKLLEEVLASRIIKANGKPTSPTIGIQELIALIKGGQE